MTVFRIEVTQFDLVVVKKTEVASGLLYNRQSINQNEWTLVVHHSVSQVVWYLPSAPSIYLTPTFFHISYWQ